MFRLMFVALGWLLVACAAWVSWGHLALAGPGPSSARVGVLPPLSGLVATGAGAVVAATLLRKHPRQVALLFASAVLILPWLPGPVPAAFLIWTGNAVWLLWCGIGTALLAPYVPSLWKRFVTRPLSPVAHMSLAGVLAFGCYMAAWAPVRSLLPGGDEPHYLIVTQSLLNDGDLRIENNHQRRDYSSYFSRDLRPDYLRRGKDNEIYSIHPLGISVAIAPVFALAGYIGVVIFLCLVSSLGTALLWHLAFQSTGSIAAAWFGWAGAALSAPFVFHAFAIYPDAPAAVLTLIGASTAIPSATSGDVDNSPRSTRYWMTHGAALAALPWLHARYALLAGLLGFIALYAAFRAPHRARNIGALFAAPLVSATVWFWYFYAIYGTPDPAAPYGGSRTTSLTLVPTGLPGILFDQQFGLLANAPVLVLALCGVWVARRRAMASLAFLLLAVPYLAMVGGFRMWWGGASAPARFAVPVVLLFGLPLAWLWAYARRAESRAVALVLLGASIALTGVLAFGDGFLQYNARDGYALWLDWATPMANLAEAVPSMIRDSRAQAALYIAVWTTGLVAFWLLVRALWTAAGRERDLLAPVSLISAVVMIMVCATIVWQLRHASRHKPATAQLALLEHLSRRTAGLGISYATGDFTSPERLLAGMLIPSLNRGTAAPNRPTYTVPALPAGMYRVELGGARSGTFDVRAGRSPGPVYTIDAADPSLERRVITFPVNVGPIVMTTRAGDEVSPGAQVWLRPVQLFGAQPTAVQSARYGPAAVFALDHRSFLEPPGFWLQGDSGARMAIVADGGAHVKLLLRSGPRPVTVSLDRSDAAGQRVYLAAGQVVPLTFPASRGPALVSFEIKGGFRPRDVDPTNRDARWLGCWVEITGAP